jgi:hypothetical protein
MSYESWRISFQSSEQAARAAFELFSSEFKKSRLLEDEINKLKGELATLNSNYQYELHVSKIRGQNIESLSTDLDNLEALIKTLKNELEQGQNLKKKAEFFISSVRSINRSDRQKIYIDGDDEPCYWQRGEWVKYILDLAEDLELEAKKTCLVKLNIQPGL